MVVMALPIRFCSSSASTRSEFQIRLRSDTDMSASPPQTLLHLRHALGAGSRCCGTPRRGPAWCAACCQPQVGHLGAALGVAGAVEPVERGLAGARRQRRLRRAGLQRLGGAMRGGAAEHHQVEQRVGAEPVGAVHGHAGRLAHRHQAGHDRVGIVARSGAAPRCARWWGCRPCCSARSAAPGSAPWSRRRRRTRARFR